MRKLRLRPYQQDCLNAIATSFHKGQNRQLISLPTGAGKTVVFANLIKERNERALILAHTSELIEQAKDKIKMICPGLDIGIVNAQNKQFEAPVVVSSIQSQSAGKLNNLERLAEQGFKLAVADECHHFAAKHTRNILKQLGFDKGTDRLLVGFTATPFRNDGRGLAEVFDTIFYQKDIKQMIEEGYLCQPNGLKITTDLDLSQIKTVDGDFQISSLSQVMDTLELNKIAVDAYLENAAGKPAICFGVNVQHAKNLAALFQSQGIISKAIYGSMPREERTNILKEYENGSLQVLCNCQILTEGFDAPQTECVIIARPTKSKGLYQQMVGRGLRLWPNKKECLILDFCDQNHSICNAFTLLQEGNQEEEKTGNNSKISLLYSLPPKFNQKLKSAIINFDPLGESFTWHKDGSVHFMKGINKSRIEILPQPEERYQVVYINDLGSHHLIAENLSFDYGFATAEDFAKENRHLFVLSDKEAAWRDMPITEKQQTIIRSCGYRAGIENLTRGQASILIGSGALRRVESENR
jgi:superfamily II DNA or RNA helicase